jgi:two-component system C4-dicarboxylate transport sensor histidine kinase DctB
MLAAFGVGIALLVSAIFWLGFAFFLVDERAKATDRAQLYRTILVDALTRHEHLPVMLAQDPAVMRAVTGPDREVLNRRLDAFASEAKLEAIYLLDASGLTIASSNYQQSVTFLGQNYGFRSYFKQAMTGEVGRFFAIGATTSRPGYFVAAPVTVDGVVRGVIVIKDDLQNLADLWASSSESVLVTNQDQIVVLTSDPDWRYKTLTALDADARARITLARQFGTEALDPLDWVSDGGRAVLGGVAALHISVDVGKLDWRLHYFAPEALVRNRAAFVTVSLAVFLVFVLAVALFVRSQRIRAALDSSQVDRRKLRNANQKLEAAQLELERSSRLAALGQLAASVTHELGQPITALQTYLAAARMDPDSEDVGELIGRLDGIAKRMEATTDQLRFFAKQGGGAKEAVGIEDVVRSAWGLLPDVGIPFEVFGQAPDVTADRHRLEQVLINVLRNAVDSGAASIAVYLGQDAGFATIRVEDTGGGLQGMDLSEMFEPFKSSRASGDGMGLGLSISAEIINQHGGRIWATENTERGLSVHIQVPVTKGET